MRNLSRTEARRAATQYTGQPGVKLETEARYVENAFRLVRVFEDLLDGGVVHGQADRAELWRHALDGAGFDGEGDSGAAGEVEEDLADVVTAEVEGHGFLEEDSDLVFLGEDDDGLVPRIPGHTGGA